MKKICPNCGVENEESAKFCINCAAKLSEEITENIPDVEEAEAEKQQKIEQQEKAKKEAEQLSYKNHFQRVFLLMWTGAYQAQESCVNS